MSYFTQHRSFKWHHSLYIDTRTVSFHPFITKTFTAFTRITRIITIISFILFQDLHILEQDIHSISYFIEHHSFQWHHSLLYPHSNKVSSRFIHQQNIHRIHQNNSYHHHYLIYLVSRSTHRGTRYPLYIILYWTSFISMTSFSAISTLIQGYQSDPFITKTFTAFTWMTHIITIISFILFQDLHILEQDIHSICILYSTSFISMTSFTLYSHSYSIIPSIHHQNIHRIHQNNSNHHHVSHLSCFKIYTSWNKISTLYHTSFTIIHFNDIIHSISTLIQCHSIHSSPKHSLHSPE